MGADEKQYIYFYWPYTTIYGYNAKWVIFSVYGMVAGISHDIVFGMWNVKAYGMFLSMYAFWTMWYAFLKPQKTSI